MTAGASIDVSGPFFRRDPEKTLMENIHKMMQAFAEEGADAARTGLASGSGNRALIRELGDRVADHAIGRTQSLSGREWYVAAVVQVLNKGFSPRQATSLMAAAAEVESETHAIADVARQLRSSRAVIRANLTEGLE